MSRFFRGTPIEIKQFARNKSFKIDLTTKRAKVKKYSDDNYKNVLLLLELISKDTKMGKIILEDMEFYAYHGCFDEEQVIGNRFLINLEIETDTEHGERTDSLDKTVNYQEVYKIVDQHMQQKSRLLENVARRILDSVLASIPRIIFARIKISKMNPPVGGKVKSVSVVLEKRSDNS